MRKTCKNCAWYQLAHYKGTPKSEVYDECCYHEEVLSDLEPCEHYAPRSVRVTEWLE